MNLCTNWIPPFHLLFCFYAETEINDLDIAVIEVLAKELEKRHEDGKAYWEHVLTDLKLKCTMREKKKISK